MVKQKRGFASMDLEKQRSIASKGGKAAHAKGRAHEWTADEAREAGRKGGAASHRQSQLVPQQQAAPQQQTPPPQRRLPQQQNTFSASQVAAIDLS